MGIAALNEQTFLNVKQVAAYLHLNEKKVYALVGDGEIPATKVTGKWMFPRELVDRWMLDSAHGGLLNDRLVISGSDDPLLHRVLAKLGETMGNKALVCYAPAGAHSGLELLQACRADVAAIHWGPDNESSTRHPALLSQYSQHPGWVMMRAFRREQGLLLNPSISAHEALENLFKADFRWAIRQSGSGALRCVMEVLARFDKNVDDLNQICTARSEHEAAAAVCMNTADISPGTRATAEEFQLQFIPLGWEAFDLVLPKSIWFRYLFQSVLKELKSIHCRKLADKLGGYDLEDCGELVWGEY